MTGINKKNINLFEHISNLNYEKTTDPFDIFTEAKPFSVTFVEEVNPTNGNPEDETKIKENKFYDQFMDQLRSDGYESIEQAMEKRPYETMYALKYFKLLNILTDEMIEKGMENHPASTIIGLAKNKLLNRLTDKMIEKGLKKHVYFTISTLIDYNLSDRLTDKMVEYEMDKNPLNIIDVLAKTGLKWKFRHILHKYGYR